jgi:predicted nucleotidyltransferase component of viral defense system
LWRSDFFDVALFQGGTSLRILHGLLHFSEGLDFMLRQPNPHFDWQHYLEPLLQTFSEFGIKSEALPSSNMDKRIRQAMIKSKSIASQLNLSFPDRTPNRKLRINLEIDIAPPPYSGKSQTFLDFPLDHRVRHQNLESNFALKIHALLCRGFLKGCDCYDSFFESKLDSQDEGFWSGIDTHSDWEMLRMKARHILETMGKSDYAIDIRSNKYLGFFSRKIVSQTIWIDLIESR